ncbi:MAG: HigA family addiction module antidote protein [Calothrix sp. FI2-JRJ7]|jgi:addiction module HigA family antidote|nr:HigA family addiction module antidote protein [Calothrix sp. FI2-JRJ7]
MKDLQEIFVNRKVRPIHPGEVISDILEDLEISQTKFAEIIGVSRRSVNEIIQGKRPITVDMAIRIGKALGNGPQLWLNLQQKVDIWDALQAHGEDYERVVTLVA